MATIEPTKLRPGRKIVIDGKLYVVLTYDHRTPGKGQPSTTVKMRSYADDNVIEKTFKGSSDHPEEAEFNQRSVQFLYSDPDGYHFMDLTTYEQVSLTEEFLGLQAKFLIAEAEVIMSYWNEAPVGLELPPKMVFEIIETQDDVARGNTSSNMTKDAILETGLKIQVPPFIKTGQKVRVSTEDGKYVERAN